MTRWGGANTAHRWLNVPDEACGRYNLHDCYWTARLLKPLLDEAKELGQLEWFIAYGEPFQHAVLDMAGRGLLLDPLALATYRDRVRAELGDVDDRIKLAASDVDFAYTGKFPNSRDQVARFLFQCLGLRPAGVTPQKKRPQVDQAALTRVLRDLRVKDEPHRKVLYDLFHRTRLFTILSRYLPVEAEVDGRVRPTIKLAHVKTGRLAYANPALQQWPEEARHIFVAKPGHIFVSADYAQLEARIMAYYSGDTSSIKVFEAGGDPHAANARDLFNLTPEAWAALPLGGDHYRGYAKTWLYRQMYGGTAASGDKKLFCPCPKCAAHAPSTLHLEPKHAAAAEERWHARHPQVKRWQASVVRDVRATHRFPLLLGGYRYMASPWSRDLDRELKNIPMQSGAARIMIRAQNHLHQAGAPIVLQHHDSFLLEVPIGDADDTAVIPEGDAGGTALQWAAKVRDVMQAPVEIGATKVSLPVDIKVGRNWGRHSAGNPEGLRKL